MASTSAVGALVALALSGAVVAPAAASFRVGDPPKLCAGDFFADQIGTEAGDALTAARRPERLWGLAGADVLTGSPTRATCLFGGRDPDTLALAGGGGGAWGEHGSDLLTGSPLDDLLDGGAGNDTIDGGLAGDSLTGGTGVDGFEGGPGDDLIDAADGRAEIVDCGPGADLIAADRSDVLIDCERPSLAGGLLPALPAVPRAAAREEIVRVRFKLPEAAGAGAYRLVLADAPRGGGCPQPGLELGRFPDAGARVHRGRSVRVGLRPPAGGWCAGRISAAVVLARKCRSGRSCAAPPPAEPLARISFRSTG